MNPALSVIAPFYNEGPAIAGFHRDLMQALRTMTTAEVIYVDDGSTDASACELRKAFRDVDTPSGISLQLLQHDTNSGQDAALLTGMARAAHPAVCFLDTDGQNPPGVIPDMLDLHVRTGGGVIHTAKRSEAGEPIPRKLGKIVFYGLLSRLTAIPYRHLNGGHFKLISKTDVRRLASLARRHPQIPLKYLAFELDGPTRQVFYYDHPARRSGTSTYTGRALLRQAFRVLAHFAGRPSNADILNA